MGLKVIDNHLRHMCATLLVATNEMKRHMRSCEQAIKLVRDTPRVTKRQMPSAKSQVSQCEHATAQYKGVGNIF